MSDLRNDTQPGEGERPPLKVPLFSPVTDFRIRPRHPDDPDPVTDEEGYQEQKEIFRECPTHVSHDQKREYYKLKKTDPGAASTMLEEFRKEESEMWAKAGRTKKERRTSELQAIWDNSPPASPSHPLLRRFGIAPCGARMHDKDLVVALKDHAGDIQALLLVNAETGVETALSFDENVAGCHLIGDFSVPQVKQMEDMCISLSFISGALTHAETGMPVMVISVEKLHYWAWEARLTYNPSELLAILVEELDDNKETWFFLRDVAEVCSDETFDLASLKVNFSNLSNVTTKLDAEAIFLPPGVSTFVELAIKYGPGAVRECILKNRASFRKGEWEAGCQPENGPTEQWTGFRELITSYCRRSHNLVTALEYVPLGPPVVNPKDPLQAAKNWLKKEFTDCDSRSPSLHYWQGDFWLFETSKYRNLSKDDMRKLAYGYLDTCVDHHGSPFQVNKARVDNILDALRGIAKLPDTITQPGFINGSGDPSDFVAFNDLLLHIPTRTRSLPTPEFFNCCTLDFDYDPSAAEPGAWLAFLHSIWGSDVQSVETLQEFFGYLITSDTSLQKSLMLIGPPRSGKGTIGRILTCLLGPANTCCPTLGALGTQFGLQTLIGKSLAIISDARVSRHSDISAVAENLQRITGEDGVSIPRKYRDDYTTCLPTRFLIMSNELPSLPDSSGAFASRFILLRLTRSFLGHEDRSLDARLNAELTGIFNWALVGLQRLKARGDFIQPTSALSLVSQFGSSPVKEFVDDECEIGPEFLIEINNLFEHWKGWCTEQNLPPVTKQMFGKMLVAAVPSVTVTQARVDDGKRRFYKGIRLRPPY